MFTLIYRRSPVYETQSSSQNEQETHYHELPYDRSENLQADETRQETLALPQWMFVTLSMVDDDHDSRYHDTTTDFVRLGRFLALPLNDTV